MLDDPGPRGGIPVLSVSGLTWTVGDHSILDDVSLDVLAGETIVIVGPSGCGKSSFLRCVGNLNVRTAGSVKLDGEEIGFRLIAGNRLKRLPDAHVASQRRKIGMVFQSFNLFPMFTALQNVTIGPMKVLGQSPGDAEAVARELLSSVGMEEKADQYPGTLSGGEQQRVAIARALAMRPRLILFDEPTSGLDPERVGDVLAVMRRLAKGGSTMIVVTHELNFAREVGSRLIFFDGGHIVEEGDPAEMLEAPKTQRARDFIRSVLR
jgi:polar amino acid transport system ATP-binding protein